VSRAKECAPTPCLVPLVGDQTVWPVTNFVGCLSWRVISANKSAED